MAEGVFGFLGVAKQNSFGTTITTSLEFIPFETEGLSETIEVLRPATLTGNFFEVNAVRGLERIEGDVSMVMHPEMSGVMLNAVFQQTTTTTANVSSGFYEHEFIPKNSNWEAGRALQPHTIEVYRDSGLAYQYTDSMLHRLSINIATNDFLKMNVGIMSRVASLMAVVSGTAPSDQPFVFDQASVSLGGVANTEFESLAVDFDNNIEGVQVLDNTRQHRFYHRGDKMTVRISGTMNFLNNSQYIKFKAFTKQALEVYMKDTSVTSGNEFLMQIPQMRFDTYSPTIDGPTRISVDFTATGEVDSNSSYAVRITMINSRATY